MSKLNIRIVTEIGENLNEQDWIDITNFVKKFPTNVKRSYSVKYYKTKLLNSPYGSSYITRVLNGSGSCVGLTTLTRKLFVAMGKKYVSYELGDSYLIKDLQGKSIYSKIINSALLSIEKKEKSNFVYSTPNSLSMPGLIKGGFVIADYKIFERILPLRFDSLFKSFLLKFLFNILIPIYLFVIKYILIFFSNNNNISLNLIRDLEELPNEYFSTNDIENHRSHNYLNWRYYNNPDQYNIYGVYYKKTYIGYLVFKETKHNNALALYLVDIYINKNYGMHFRTIVSKAIISNNIYRYAYVATWISKKSIYWKHISNCFLVKFKNIPFIVHQKLSDDVFLETHNKNLHFVLADGDNI